MKQERVFPHSRLFIFVPKRGSFADRHIGRGSAVIGYLTKSQDLNIFFEGDIYSHDQGETYKHRIERLATRIFRDVPDAPMLQLKRSMRQQLIPVGRINSAMKIQFSNDNSERLADMYGNQLEDPPERTDH